MLELVTPESVGLDSGQLARVHEHLDLRYVTPRKIPGCITLVARGGQPCYLDIQGHRDAERGTRMTEDSILRIYSMSKPITSLAIMTLLDCHRPDELAATSSGHHPTLEDEWAANDELARRVIAARSAA